MPVPSLEKGGGNTNHLRYGTASLNRNKQAPYLSMRNKLHVSLGGFWNRIYCKL